MIILLSTTLKKMKQSQREIENECKFRIQTMTSMNYFDSSRKNLTIYFEWKSVMREMHVITKCTTKVFLH